MDGGMIMEDFVTFEIAKKLKEKGFREGCFATYTPYSGTLKFNEINTDQRPTSYKLNIEEFRECYNYYEENNIDAPTISQVLKLLFDEKQLFVNIDCNVCDEFGLFFTIYKKGEETWEACGFDDNYYNKPEEAALAGIKYVLDNLI